MDVTQNLAAAQVQAGVEATFSDAVGGTGMYSNIPLSVADLQARATANSRAQWTVDDVLGLCMAAFGITGTVAVTAP